MLSAGLPTNWTVSDKNETGWRAFVLRVVGEVAVSISDKLVSVALLEEDASVDRSF